MRAMQRWMIAVLGGSLLGTGCYSGVDGFGNPDGAPVGADGGDSAGDDDGGDDGIPGECGGEQGGSIVRRLTTVEYVNTVADTLGVDIAADAETRLPADLRADGFSNQVGGLLVTFDHIEAYHDLAGIIVESKADLAGWITAHSDCLTLGDAACEESFIERAGLRVWRRPLTADEVASLRPIFAAAAEEGDDFATGAGFVLEAMLQAPQFIYRLEVELPDDGAPGDLRTLSDYEIASRLSYLLWSTSPDDALFDAAGAGSLHTEEQIAEQVERMLADPRAKDTAMRYVADWLALDGLPSITRDPELYPEFTVALAEDMREETLRVAEELLWEQRAPFTALLTADFTWATPELAALYGMESQGEGWQRYSLDGVEHRLGMLTHAGIQAINGHGNRPSIVERGLFVLGGVLCSTVAAPPADLDIDMSDLEEDRSPRYYSEARLDNPTCNACHGQFDPMGWAFEPFDGIGAWNAQDELGNDLKEDGWLLVPGSGEQVPYQTVEEFAHVLSEEEQVSWCIGVRKPLQFAVGRPLGIDDACMSDEIAAASEANGDNYHSLMAAIATHPSFRLIRTEG